MTSESPVSKQVLRKEAHLRQKELSTETVVEKSRTITETLLQLPEIKLANTLCVYVSTDREVQTDEFINELIEEGKYVYIPKITDNTLTLHHISSLSTLTIGTFSIREPDTHSPTIHPEHIDIFIVPGLGFDIQGTRLGRGKGWYDRLLEQVTVPKIGLAFSSQIFPLLPRNDYDILMDIIVTEEKIIRPIHA